MSQIKRVLLLVPVLVLSIAVLGVRASADASNTIIPNADAGDTSAANQQNDSESGDPVHQPEPTNDGSNDNSGSSSQTGNGENDQSGDQPGDTSEASATITSSDEGQTETEDLLHERGQGLLQQAEDQHKGKVKTQAQVEKVCKNRQKGMQSQINGIATHAQSSLSRINQVFSEAASYEQSNNLTVNNFDSLVSAATTAQSTATTSVQALQALKPIIDCASSTTSSPASQIAIFQAAVKQARTDLLAYRSSVRDVLVALEKTKQSSGTTSTTGGNQ